jgi:WhiB family transcriptional regulator, redox-sensing transcriptional regulator
VSSRLFEEVYADAAMDRECPNCQAPPHRWCKRPNGETPPDSVRRPYAHDCPACRPHSSLPAKSARGRAGSPGQIVLRAHPPARPRGVNRELAVYDGVARRHPGLPGARCKGKADLFEAIIAEHGVDNQPTTDELEIARRAALRLCAVCPALDPCRVWLDGLRPTRRPRGVIAGQVVTSTGVSSSTRTTADHAGSVGLTSSCGSGRPSDRRDEADE